MYIHVASGEWGESLILRYLAGREGDLMALQLYNNAKYMAKSASLRGNILGEGGDSRH